MAANLAGDKFWPNKNLYHDAEKKYYEDVTGKKTGDMGIMKLNQDSVPKSSLAEEVAKARQHLKSSLECADQSLNSMVGAMNCRLIALLERVETAFETLNKRLETLEQKCSNNPPPLNTTKVEKNDDDDDDVDLFGSESEEDEDAKKIREKRLAEYAEKKSKKPALVAKSNIILDIKPWDDETDMKEMEKAVRAIEMDGLVWGASKLVPVAFKIFKLQISCVVEDDKVSVDLLTETLEAIEDYVQSVDIAAFNKV